MWIYKENTEINSLKDIPEGAIGFIYRITLIQEDGTLGRFYVGKKQLFSVRRTRLSKREKETTNSRKTFKTVTTESNWLSYWSSCKELQEEVKQKSEECFLREIVEFCFSKRDLNYTEVWWQFKLDVLANDTYNGNIASRWFKEK